MRDVITKNAVAHWLGTNLTSALYGVAIGYQGYGRILTSLFVPSYDRDRVNIVSA